MRRSSLGPAVSNLVLWHGAHRWEGPVEVREQRRGHSEHGPGVYLTTSVQTARKYAKGGGVIVRFEIDPRVRWLERGNDGLPLDEVVAWLKSRRNLRGRDVIIERLRDLASRRPDPSRIQAAWLLNLMVNENAASGTHGVALAKLLVRYGIDASHAKNSSDEDWVVIFNPDVVVKAWRVSGSTNHGDAPRVLRQLEGLGHMEMNS